MKRNNSYKYPKTQREKIEGKRHYVFDKEKLPSVTTILSATESDEKRESLAAWREKVGEDNATRIVDEAAARGTAMHKILEKYVLGEGYLDETHSVVYLLSSLVESLGTYNYYFFSFVSIHLNIAVVGS